MTQHGRAEPLVVVGIGGLGREVLDVIAAVNAAGPPRHVLVGALDDHPSDVNRALLEDHGVPYLGTVDSWIASGRQAEFVIGIADAGHRRRADHKLSAAGYRAATLVHPLASTGSLVVVGPGSIVCAGARLTTSITLGRHVHIHVNATVGHDSTLDDYSSVYPQGAVSGSCTLESGTTVGAHATVLQGRRVGRDGFVGAGAVVTTDVEPGSVVKGIPAR